MRKKISLKLQLGKKQVAHLTEIRGGNVQVGTVQGSGLPRCVSRPPGTCLCMTYEECEKTQHEAIPL